MSKILFDKQPIVIDRDVATKLGLEEAVIVQQIHYWMEINRESKRNQHDGRSWTYNTYAEWHKQFPFMSEIKIRRTIKALESKGILVTGNYNELKIDNTKWYSIDYDVLESVVNPVVVPSDQNEQTVCSKRSDDVVNLTRPLPENTTENKTLSIINNIVIIDDVLNEIAENAKSLDKSKLYELTTNDTNALANSFLDCEKTLLKDSMPSPPLLLYFSITKTGMKKHFPFDVNRQSFAKLFITYVKLNGLPSIADVNKMVSFLREKLTPSIIGRAMKNAHYKGVKNLDELNPFIAEVQEIDRLNKQKHIGDTFKEKQQKSSLRYVDKDKFDSF